MFYTLTSFLYTYAFWYLLNEPPDPDSFLLIQLPSAHTYDCHLNKTFVKLYDNLYQNNSALWQGNTSIQKWVLSALSNCLNKLHVTYANKTYKPSGFGIHALDLFSNLLDVFGFTATSIFDTSINFMIGRNSCISKWWGSKHPLLLGGMGGGMLLVSKFISTIGLNLTTSLSQPNCFSTIPSSTRFLNSSEALYSFTALVWAAVTSSTFVGFGQGLLCHP